MANLTVRKISQLRDVIKAAKKLGENPRVVLTAQMMVGLALQPTGQING